VHTSCALGYTLVELMFVSALMVTVAGASVPQALITIDAVRAAGAARHISARLQRVRMEAIARSTPVAMQFTANAGRYTYAVYVDGNRNGVLTRDIRDGIDRRIGAVESLGDSFTGVDFGASPDLPPVDPGGAPPGADPIRLGASSLLTFTALGTSSTGSLYLRGRRGEQYVIRIFGETGKTRVLKFDVHTQQWKPQ
jgi:type II secretory pathway pseudopilin PulG